MLLKKRSAVMIVSMLLVVACLSGLVPDKMAHAQQAAAGANVTMTGARGDAATRVDCASGATQQTVTLVAPGPGQSNYVTGIWIWGMASGIPTAATPTMGTLTGLAGTTPSTLPLASVYPAAGAAGSVSGGPLPLATPIKGSTATAMTAVGPTAITNMTQVVCIAYYSAP